MVYTNSSNKFSVREQKGQDIVQLNGQVKRIDEHSYRVKSQSITAHAREKTIARGIDAMDIQRIINEPIETIYNEYEETYKSYGEAIDPYTKKPYYVIMIHTALNKYVTIISVMFTDKGGLKFHGFSKL